MEEQRLAELEQMRREEIKSGGFILPAREVEEAAMLANPDEIRLPEDDDRAKFFIRSELFTNSEMYVVFESSFVAILETNLDCRLQSRKRDARRSVPSVHFATSGSGTKFRSRNTWRRSIQIA